MKTFTLKTAKRALYLFHLDARQRYLEFENKHRDLLQALPQKLLAKYIGIIPEFLPKLRRELMEEERQKPKK